MPNKKGSRVAASRAKSQAKAKKKARSTGPVLAAAAFQAPVADDAEPGMEEAEAQVATVDPGTDEAQTDHEAPQAAPAAAPLPRRARSAPRRERQAMVAVQGGNLRREVILITAVTALTGAVLAVLKIATDLGR
jgi:hypothetical protein